MVGRDGHAASDRRVAATIAAYGCAREGGEEDLHSRPRLPDVDLRCALHEAAIRQIMAPLRGAVRTFGHDRDAGTVDRNLAGGRLTQRRLRRFAGCRRPCSVNVGTWGSAAARLAPVCGRCGCALLLTTRSARPRTPYRSGCARRTRR